MDELKDKLKKLSLFGSKGSSGKKTSGAFSGTGHKLGSAPAQVGGCAERNSANRSGSLPCA